MKMRFWQKTYLLTLLLFLLCLNIGILSLAVYTHRKNIQSSEDAASAEQYYIARSFEQDYTDLKTMGANVSESLLFQSYGNYYSDKGILLAFYHNGKLIYKNADFPSEIEKNILVHTEIDKQHHILISSEICDGKYSFIYGKNTHTLDEEFASIMVTYIITALAVSLFLAVILYLILKRLSLPLERLRLTTEKIENGDFSVKAEEIGNDEITLLSKSFNGMLDKINEQMLVLESDSRKKQQLVDNLAHELRTPLTSIRGYAEFLEKAAVNEKNRLVAVKYIISESERLKKISDILLDSAFIRGSIPQMSTIDLADIVNDISQKLKPKADSMGVTIYCQTHKAIVSANETLISMLLYNLGDNAVKACSEGGIVKLISFENTITVEDNGKGMSAEHLAHITEPFYRVDKSRSRAEGGVGLGLALCKQIADAHGAKLDFYSKLGEGTKITVKFTS